MPTVSVISAWHGETGSLLADYYRSVEGGLAEVISIDNACPPATADALREMTEHLCGVYVRNETNLGFAAANNQGYAKATGDIIIFLNSDVAPAGPWLHQTLKDVRDGALYGPSLGYQLVAGRHLPYIEGWCIAGTRKTWERLSHPDMLFKVPPATTTEDFERIRAEIKAWHDQVTKPIYLAERNDIQVEYFGSPGPWDACAFPCPYWEDNDLCLRAMQLGIPLIQTAWPIQHKGGQTAGPIIRHGESFARNEYTFTQRVLAAFTTPLSTWTDTYARYMQYLHTPSDIQHHLPLLYSLARGNVVELGTRTGVSTAALLAGVEARGGRVWSVDLDDCGALFAGHPQWTFIRGDSRDYETTIKVTITSVDWDGIDLLLIDSEHVYEITQAELVMWERLMKPGARILLHDIETFPGVRRAVAEFCAAHGWTWTAVLPCHGMAIVEVPK